MFNKVGERQFRRLGYISLTLFLLITTFLAFQLPKTKFDYNFEAFFPAASEETDFFFQHRETFGSDNDFILIAIENKQSIFNFSFLNDVKSFSEKIAKIENVRFTRDITHENELILYPGNRSSSVPYISFDSNNLEADSIRIFQKKELINSLVSPNAKSLLIYVRHTDELSKAKGDTLVEHIRGLATNYSFDKVHLAGRTIGQIYYIETMTIEMGKYIGLSMILVITFLLLAFRSLWGLLIPQIVIVGSTIWILGFMALIDQPVNILMTILPSIMFVVSMSDVIHLVSKYFDLLRLGTPKFEAILISFKEIGLATFLTSVTTTIGFLSLIFVNVIPIQEFGIYIGIGVIMAFVITFSVLPFLFLYTKPPKLVNTEKWNVWKPWLLNAYSFTVRNRKSILIGTGIFVIILIIGTFQIKSNNFLMDDLKPSNPMKQSFNFMDSTFGGVRPFELAVNLEDTSKSFWHVDILKQLDTVETYLTHVYGVDIKLSLVHSLKLLNRSNNLGDSAQFELPTKKSTIKKFKRMLKIAEEGNFINLILDSTETTMRISGGIPDCGNQKISALNIGLKDFISKHTNSQDLSFTLTGTAHLLDKNMSYLSGSLVKGLLFAVLLVAIIMGILYRSVKMVVVSLLPNLIPLLVIAAIMGYFGINLKITTAIVFTIAFGIAVDDTIHFLSKFKLELKGGKSVPYALKRTTIATGKAIVLTSAILCSGFMLLLFSDFLGTFYMGLMISTTLFFAVLADLFLLPALILTFFKEKEI